MYVQYFGTEMVHVGLKTVPMKLQVYYQQSVVWLQLSYSLRDFSSEKRNILYFPVLSENTASINSNQEAPETCSMKKLYTWDIKKINKDKYEILSLSLILKDGNWPDYLDIRQYRSTKEKQQNNIKILPRCIIVLIVVIPPFSQH